MTCTRLNLQQDRGASLNIYNPVTLSIYDAGVLGLTNALAWKCPTRDLVALYQKHAGRQHLDMGPGTGFFLTQIGSSDITLIDQNPASLSTARRRIGDHARVEARQQSFFTELGPGKQFDSIGANFLLHCIPTPAKWDRLAGLYEHLLPGGTLFGSTIIPDPGTANPLARFLLGLYNRLGVFGNANDSTAHLTDALTSRFDDVHITRRGQVVLFTARRPLED